VRRAQFVERSVFFALNGLDFLGTLGASANFVLNISGAAELMTLLRRPLIR
jgi:hypothetical protein